MTYLFRWPEGKEESLPCGLSLLNVSVVEQSLCVCDRVGPRVGLSSLLLLDCSDCACHSSAPFIVLIKQSISLGSSSLIPLSPSLSLVPGGAGREALFGLQRSDIDVCSYGVGLWPLVSSKVTLLLLLLYRVLLCYSALHACCLPLLYCAPCRVPYPPPTTYHIYEVFTKYEVIGKSLAWGHGLHTYANKNPTKTCLLTSDLRYRRGAHATLFVTAIFQSLPTGCPPLLSVMVLRCNLKCLTAERLLLSVVCTPAPCVVLWRRFTCQAR